MLAIDLGSTALRVIETHGRGKDQVRVLGAAPTGDLIDRSGFIRDEYGFQRLLLDLLRSLDIDTDSRPCAIALTSSAVAIKRVELDSDPSVQPREQMRYLAEQCFATDIRDLQLSLKVLGSTPHDPSMVSGLLIGARRDVLEQRLATIKACGLQVAVVDCAAICFYNALLLGGALGRGSHLLVAIGHSAADVSIIQDGVFVYHRQLGLAGRDYTDDVARQLGISADQAEKVKLMISTGSRPAAPELLKLIHANNDELVDEIESAVAEWWRECKGKADPLRSAFLTGGAAMMLGFRKAIEDGLGLQSQIFNPFNQISPRAGRDEMLHLAAQGHTYSVAVGLALHNQLKRSDTRC
jgi:type IV pilus assembly protein PilM